MKEVMRALLQIAHFLRLSQTEIALHLGVRRSTVSQWVSGARPIPEKYEIAIACLVDDRQAQWLEGQARRGYDESQVRQLCALKQAWKASCLQQQEAWSVPYGP